MMTGPAQETPKDALTGQLYQLFRSYGYEGVSIGAISAATGLGRSSLYHHFPGGKEEMAAAVVARARDTFTRNVFAPLRSDAPPRRRLKDMLAVMDRAFAGGRDPCLIASMLVGEGADPVTDGLRAILREWLDALAECLSDIGVPKSKAARLSSSIVGRIEGALILSRGLDDTSHFAAALADIEGMPELAAREA
jgi:TetR/AcrR family transcriptional regulator, lmrAB and yxaGH operons repressor